nr:3-phosphoshikimate 1-carboxyvinyltransferase [Pseudomonas sp.]
MSHSPSSRRDRLPLASVRHARGTVPMPGSKSISNRVLLLSALAQGETRISGLLDSDDTRVMLDSLRALGVAIVGDGADGVRIAGCSSFPNSGMELFLGNAGTAFRPLTAALAVIGGNYRMGGVPRMHERPIGDLVDALRLLGASIDYTGQPGYPPLAISHASTLNLDAPIVVQGSVSSQFLTA